MQNHYNYVFDNITNTYNFTTRNNILYRVAFIVDETFSAISGEEIANIFQLIVEKANEEIEPYDAKVSKTIENIIDRFFQRIENSLVYVCSDEDEKAKIRYDVFDRWYKKSEFKANVVKIDNILNINISKTEIHKLYTSFMFHKNNSNYHKLIEIYSKIEETLNSK
ncbi:hypothetical protein HER18_03495 [Chryseobacterium sp. NEB161]|nr:hypothetical protein HER18_03495 [Chryseobacterium sp. NEB161]